MSAGVESFGERVKDAREASGMSQRAFAELVGIDRSALARLESGVRDPRLSEALAIADALGLRFGGSRPTGFNRYITAMSEVRQKVEIARMAMRDSFVIAVALEESFTDEMEAEALRQYPQFDSLYDLFISDLQQIPEVLQNGSIGLRNVAFPVTSDQDEEIAAILSEAVLENLFVEDMDPLDEDQFVGNGDESE